MTDPQERQVLLEGMDFVELAADGRLQRITGFFGAFPPILESRPEHLVWGAADNKLTSPRGQACLYSPSFLESVFSETEDL